MGWKRLVFFPSFSLSALFFLSAIWISSNAQITPPPRDGRRPVIANGRVYYLDHIPTHCQPPFIDQFPGGKLIKDNRALLAKDSPHIIRGNIEIAKTGCLYIEPGAVLKFGPGYGMIINGTLIARGSEWPGGRITMTKADGEDHGSPSGDWQDDARLVMGNTTKDGRLDLMYQGKWRAICTNYSNFTAIDANVTCRHLGFLKGNFTFHSYSRNLTDHILWEKPECRGSEKSLFACPGVSSIRTGRHICDGQEVVGFECEGLRPGLALDHWRGLDFYNSTTESKFQILESNAVYMKEADSFLEYLDISYTGLDIFHGQTSEPNIFYQKAAISASPHVPKMNNVTIRYGAYDGLNLTQIEGPIVVANSTISDNRGYGIFIQSSIGRALVNVTTVSNNWGDGIKFYLSNLTIFDFRLKFPPENHMCNQANLRQQIFPFYQYMDMVSVTESGRKKAIYTTHCDRTFRTTEDMRIGVHFMIMERDPEAAGKFIIRDGGSNGRTLAVVPIHNGSFPQSLTTKTNAVHVRFEPHLPSGGICKSFPPCIRFLLEFTAGPDVEEEFRLDLSTISNNTGYGVNIQDVRSKVRISNKTTIINNQFGAGIRIYRGAGEILIEGTVLDGNADSGVNITYSGGFQIINNTHFLRNKGYGMITEYIKLNHTRIEHENRIEIVRADFSDNELIGLRMGNYCKGGEIKINESVFASNYDDAFEYLSCNISTSHNTKLIVQFNEFEGNLRHAIIMKPLLNTEGLISNNSFSNHPLAGVRIDNGFDLLISRWYRDFPVKLNIFENKFLNNRGRYAISLRLTEYSAVQESYCKFNYFENNEISNSFPYLTPRSRANAVAVISSSNVKFQRNIMQNPLSIREIATHLTDPSAKIDATENYWGIEIQRKEEFEHVFKNIFDQDDRFNLAQVKYEPALTTDRFYQDYFTDVSPYEWKFDRPGNVIGGVLESRDFIAQARQTYYVDRDIFIHPNVLMELPPGTTLKFQASIGMVVHGLLKAEGQRHDTPVIFSFDDREPPVPMENRTASVRLVDGIDEYEGRLEVEIDGEWGTVCSEGWIEENALLACKQLGLTLDSENPIAKRRNRAPPDMNILMSWVSCTEVDVDLTKCRAIFRDTGTCSHAQDVYLRCQTPTWAGITLAAADHNQERPWMKESKISHAKILNAGLFDSDTATLTPALRIDYNFFEISYLTIHKSMSDAIYVAYNDPYFLHKMEYLDIRYNKGNGIVTKSPRLMVNHSFIEYNDKAGYIYDPFLTEYNALLIRNMIFKSRQVDMFEKPVRIVKNDKMIYLLCSPGKKIEKKDYYVQVQGQSQNRRLTIQILDYLPVMSAEKVTIFKSLKNGVNLPDVQKWEIDKDLVDFPLLVESSAITIKLSVDGLMSGRLAMVISSGYHNTDPPYLYTEMTNTTIAYNDQGIVTRHYNNPSNKRLELFMRHKQEHIYFKNVRLLKNTRHAIHMPSVTKFDKDYIPTYEDMTKPERTAMIIYTVTHCQVENNGHGILAEHNHVDFANNVWQWKIDTVAFIGNKRGGLEVEVPRVNDESQQNLHSVSVVDCPFQDNEDFAFAVAGYYATVKIDRNLFRNNRCLLGLISLSGMEKNLTFQSNNIKENIGKYVLDMDILSHAEHSGQVFGLMSANFIIDNHYEGLPLPGAPGSPKTYTVSIRGLQKMVIYQNIFVNKQMDYELVAGVTALSLENDMNATVNYWGSVDETVIRKRIFDFDDWNNYAIAQYCPFLQRPDLNSMPATNCGGEINLDLNHLGGRVEKSLVLLDRGRPFIVETDLTIVPGVTLKIPPGIELQFRPNVGILVLGRLIARGLPYKRIKMRPVQPSSDLPLRSSVRNKRDVTKSSLRLRGNFTNAGFLELYNTSTRSWNMMCDSQFNDKTAEVVCRELGKETVNVKVRFTHLYDHYIYGKPMYSLKEFWYNSYLCRGDENYLDQCVKRYNYNLQSCVVAANYTFITCGDRNLEEGQDYWGNIRFATESYEEKPLEADIGKDQSVMAYVDIEGAGILHGQKVGAIQTSYVTPELNHINISKCADNGYDIVAPRQSLKLSNQNISSNLGYGINVLVLNGESRDDKSSFLPHGPSSIPYNVYGFVDICSLEKELTLKTRLILFYKYGPHTRDCVKIIRAFSSNKAVGLRFLQLNLFHEDFSRNVIEIFDGKNKHNIVANTSTDDVLQRFDSFGNTLTVHIHASLGHEIYGFVAEVVKVPVSGLTYADSRFSHEIEQMEIRRNENGAILYKNVGETNPSLYVEHCYIVENGFPVLNLTSPPTIHISLQSTIAFRFSHNQVTHNIGGMYINALTSSTNTALSGNITNNVFAFGSHGEALNISGHYFQRLMLHQNYIYNYTSGDYRDIIHVKEVVVNLTHNYVLRNVGHYIINTYSSDDSAAPQLFTRNGIYDNNSTAIIQSTIKISKGSPNFTQNFLLNSLNDFEMETFPKTNNNEKPISAKSNWWGSERRVFINGKIYDTLDNPSLVEVDFWTPIVDNRSLITGDCLPGWVMNKGQCYRYMGGALPFEKAKQFCRSHGAFLADSRDQTGFFNYLIRLMVINPNWAQRVWVMSNVGSHRCSAFEVEYIVFEEDCDRRYYPFICETDPFLQPSTETATSNMVIGIASGVGGFFIILVIVVVILWILKSKRREKERFERTASIRSSLNNLNKISGSLRGTKSTLTMLSEGHSRRRLNELDERSMNSYGTKHSQSSAASNGINGSVYSINSGYDANPEPVSTGRRENSRPLHSLRPDRTGRRNNRDTEDQERRDTEMRRRELDRERRRREDEDDIRQRQKPSRKEDVDMEDSDEDSINKRGLDDSDYDDEDSYDSEFDGDEELDNDRGHDHVTADNVHYNLHRSHEKLMEKSATDDELAYGARGNKPMDNTSYKPGLPPVPPNKLKPFSSFAPPEDDRRAYPEKWPIDKSGLSRSRENLPTPPPDPRTRAPLSDFKPNPSSKPVPKPKPQPPIRRDAGPREPPQKNIRYPSPAPRRTMGSQELLYNNERVPQNPVYDPVYDGRKTPDDGRGQSSNYGSVSKKDPLYDPVYDGSSLNQSNSTNRYEPMDLHPDTDYMPRPLGNPALGRSRERLGPSPAPPLPSAKPNQRYPLESDIDSYAPSIMSDVDYMPRQFQPKKNNFADSLPGMNSNEPRRDRHGGSRDYMNTELPQPPPYSVERDARSMSGSREHLDDHPPPYSPGNDLRSRHHGRSQEVLYFNQGARQKNNESLETEI